MVINNKRKIRIKINQNKKKVIKRIANYIK